MPFVEDLGFSRTHRRDGSAEYFESSDTFANNITSQLTQTEQIFPDLSLTNNLIESFSVTKLTAGTITSQKINLAVLDTTGDVWIACGTADFTDTTNGFILGIDDSDSNKVKLRVGDASSYLDWNITTLNTLTIAGTLVATAGSIGGWTINATSLTDAAGTVGMSSAVTVGDDIRFWAGDSTPASAEFRVFESGALVATSATITGAITATSGRRR